eukprot:CAMPEP_0204335428 /NCGR_PEP_ID=MMETSP0469-20131031/18767_1 /ASSEMBLY_ACC=CAM_ASM_000384 /TAXON_ID=2969 /ORGANISM="Oxyrrhis marina" /LENGTH=56 /DNA_ID=CAMNT_0051319089 /DNA_START=65 /DNA_END=235 /DNA_ORIENTATION=+
MSGRPSTPTCLPEVPSLAALLIWLLLSLESRDAPHSRRPIGVGLLGGAGDVGHNQI